MYIIKSFLRLIAMTNILHHSFGFGLAETGDSVPVPAQLNPRSFGFGRNYKTGFGRRLLARTVKLVAVCILGITDVVSLILQSSDLGRCPLESGGGIQEVR